MRIATFYTENLLPLAKVLNFRNNAAEDKRFDTVTSPTNAVCNHKAV